MKVRFSRIAQADITAIFDYIARDNPAAARRVVKAIEHPTSLLARHPRLPYIAVYQITATSVDVIGVFHTAQDRPRGYGG